jgi:hypothetical protein
LPSFPFTLDAIFALVRSINPQDLTVYVMRSCEKIQGTACDASHGSNTRKVWWTSRVRWRNDDDDDNEWR